MHEISLINDLVDNTMITNAFKDITKRRTQILIRGIVQGMGFRPFIFRLANKLGLTGYVCNTTEGITIEAEGTTQQLETFFASLKKDKPEYSIIQDVKSTFLAPIGSEYFNILESDSSTEKATSVLPDLATCSDCLKELFDPANRRYLYPFTNCTHCGPRFSIIESLPYDRQNTSMKEFQMCAECENEYRDPSNRRFHAQPNACPTCGPQLELWDKKGRVLGKKHQALIQAVDAIKGGKIIAVKGIGGFHLFVDAKNEESIHTLRKRKHRKEKPFALMFPSLKSIESVCVVSDKEKELLLSTEAPIVLLLKMKNVDDGLTIAHSVSPENPFFGVILPYAPLYHILMFELRSAVVATSGNISEEPICIDEHDALIRLNGIADYFLIHNRPIIHQIDDSIVRILMNRPYVLRRSRGYAPLPIPINEEIYSILAYGGHLKNTIALSVKKNVYISQHIGDLETCQSFEAFKRTGNSLKKLYKPSLINLACDTHPEYLSTKHALQSDLPVISVQHHHSHIVSCMAENHIDGTVLGISWDGTGFGTDQTIWGGEFLMSTLTDFKRVGHFKTFPLPGGENSIREPRRTAIGLLSELYEDSITYFYDIPTLKAFSQSELLTIEQMIKNNINSPLTSSLGRLFDVVASFLGLCQRSRFEGQGAMSLEHALQGVRTDDKYNFDVINATNSECDVSCGLIIDWSIMIKEIINDIRLHVSTGNVSAKFHNTVVEMAITVAKRLKEKRVVLSGGCFQNLYLTERLICRLREEGFVPYWHQWVPTNDGGISLGQAVVAANRVKEGYN